MAVANYKEHLEKYFTKAELEEYCREKGIELQGRLKKSELAHILYKSGKRHSQKKRSMWEEHDEELVSRMYNKGATTQEIAYVLGRTEGAISSKLGQFASCDDEEDDRKNQKSYYAANRNTNAASSRVNINIQNVLGSTSSSSSNVKIFSGYTFVLSGGLSMQHSELKTLIIRKGGRVEDQPDNSTNYVVQKNEDIYNSKTQKAIELKIPIIKETFIHDSIERKRLLNPKSYKISITERTDDYSSNSAAYNPRNSGSYKPRNVNHALYPNTLTAVSNTQNFIMNAYLQQENKNKKSTKRKYSNDYDDEEPSKKRKKLNKSKRNWNKKQVSQWIGSLGNDYQRYQRRFEDAGINGRHLIEFDDEDLADIVSNRAHRKIILSEWKELS